MTVRIMINTAMISDTPDSNSLSVLQCVLGNVKKQFGLFDVFVVLAGLVV